ncbi:class I tRNA ligase family protein, partial [Mycobacterium kansasii]
AAFEALQRAVGSTFDRFIRTTDADHYEASKAIWQKMVDAGDIYLGKYSGWYSVRDEAYYAEDETTVTEDGTRVSTDTGTEVEWTEE